MPTSTVTLAWAIQVPVELFGAHLEAYANLRPVIDTLRLCNRFGQGEKATVTKLPVEMVQQIEDYLMEEERAVQLEEWTEYLRCWQGECEPIEHLSDDQIVDVFDDCKAHAGLPFRPARTCTPEVRQYVVDELKMLYQMGYEWGDMYWREDHNDRVDSWFGKVGAPTQSRRGRLEQLSSLFLRDFGLQVWVRHGESEAPSCYMHDFITGSTLCYLYMPRAWSTSQEWYMNVADPEYSPRRRSTEIASAHDVTVPPKPGAKSLARFDRALKILAVDSPQCKPQKEQAATDGKSEESGEEADQATKTIKTNVEPKLKAFLEDQADEDYW